MRKIILSIAVCLLFIGTIAQAQRSSKNKVKGNGNVITEKRTTADYEEIKVAGFYDVELVAGKEGTITVEGEENLLKYVKIEVVENALKIYTENKINLSPSAGEGIRVTVPFEKISKIVLTGSGNIITKSTIKAVTFKVKLVGSGNLNLDVDTDKTEVTLTGSGDVKITGKANLINNKLSGSGDVDTSTLKAKNAEANVSGSGDMFLFCSESINARVSGSGNIKYLGNPEKKNTKVSGSGRIAKS